MNIIPRPSHNTNASWPLRLFTLWIRFIAFSPLGWLSIGLWSVVKQPCYIHCNISMEKLIFITVKYRLALFRSINTLLILIDCKSKSSCRICSTRFLIFLESHLSLSTSIYDHSRLFCGDFWYFRRKKPISGVHCVHRFRCTFCPVLI
jgi:hypothetical protein